MDNVTAVLASLQRTQEQQHLYTLQRLDALRDQMDTLHQHAMARMDLLHHDAIARTDSLHQQLSDRMDRNMRWVIGIMFAHMTATVGILVRLLLT